MFRKILYWYLPLVAAITAACLFGYGLLAFARGDIGQPVSVPAGAPSAAPTAASQQPAIAPLILGDSLGRGTGDETGLGIGGRLEADLRQRHLSVRPLTNLAVNGARSPDLLALLAHPNVRTLIAQSNVIVVSIGGNDLFGTGDWRSAPPRDPDVVMVGVLDRIDSIVKAIRAANPRARIFLIGLYNPFGSTPYGRIIGRFVNRWNGMLLERFEADPNLTIVQTSDLFAYRDRLSFDRFHPNQEGYALIARRIADSI